MTREFASRRASRVPADIIMLGYLAVLALAVAVLAQSFSMPPPVLEPLGPAAFPFWISVGLIACGCGALAERVYRRRGAASEAAGEPAAAGEGWNGWAGLIAVTVMTGLYVLALQLLQAPFTWTTAAYLFATSAIFSQRKAVPLLTLLIACVVLSVVLDYVFTQFLFIDISG